MELRAFFNSRTRSRVNRVLRNQLAGDVLNWVAYRLRGKYYFCQLIRPPTVQFPYLDTWKVFKESGEGGLSGYWSGQCILHDSPTTTCSKTPYLLHYSDCAGS